MSTNPIPLMVPVFDGKELFPRRSCLQHLIPAELKLYEAISTVDELPADPELTDIVVRLQEQRERLADLCERNGWIKPI